MSDQCSMFFVFLFPARRDWRCMNTAVITEQDLWQNAVRSKTSALSGQHAHARHIETFRYIQHSGMLTQLPNSLLSLISSHVPLEALGECDHLRGWEREAVYMRHHLQQVGRQFRGFRHFSPCTRGVSQLMLHSRSVCTR